MRLAQKYVNTLIHLASPADIGPCYYRERAVSWRKLPPYLTQAEVVNFGRISLQGDNNETRPMYRESDRIDSERG